LSRGCLICLMFCAVHVILLVALLLGIGFILNILACALQWPGAPAGVSWFAPCVFPIFFFFFFFFFSRYSLFAIAFLLSSPVPVLLCRGSSDPFADEQSSLPDLGFFLTGFLATSGIALPAVLLGGGVIVYQTLIMSIAGSLVCGIAVVILLKFVLGGGSGSQEMF
jgi:hypothetical protein